MMTRNIFGRLLLNRQFSSAVRRITQLLVIIINVLVVVLNFSANEPTFAISDSAEDQIVVLLHFLSFVGLAFIALETLQFILVDNLLLIFERYRHYRIQHQLADSHWLFSKQPLAVRGWILFRCALSGSFIFCLFKILIGVIALYSPSVYFILIFDFLLDMPVIHSIFRALHRNGRMLFVVVILIVLFVALLSNFIVAWMPGHLLDEEGEDVCSDFGRCFIKLLWALPSGGEKIPEWASLSVVSDSIFVFLYWVILSILMMNMFLAVIVDALADMRKMKTQTAEKMANTCLICGFPRHVLDKYGVGFDVHRKEEHPPLEYMEYYISLLEMELNMRNADELMSGTEAILLGYFKVEGRSVSTHIFPVNASYMMTKSQISQSVSAPSSSSSSTALPSKNLQETRSSPQSPASINTQLIKADSQEVRDLALSLSAIRGMKAQLTSIEKMFTDIRASSTSLCNTITTSSKIIEQYSRQ